MEWEKWVGLAVDGKTDFWLRVGAKTTPIVHVAFRAQTKALVDQFYKEAIAAGGKDNGTLGIREIYHPNYTTRFF